MRPEVQRLILDDRVLKYRLPKISPTQTVVMLHGWTGDENSMWVFGSQLSDDHLLIAPRGPYPTQGNDLGGFSWINHPLDTWPVYSNFLPAVSWLDNLVHDFYQEIGVDRPNTISLVGFSQGTPMSIVYAGAKTINISKLAALSGFLPDQWEGFFDKEALREVDVFIGHGEKDETVPVEKARHLDQFMEDRARSVQMCLSDVGHRLGSECFEAFKEFMAANRL